MNVDFCVVGFSATVGYFDVLQVGVLDEGEQALEVALLVVVDEEVVVALGAAEVHAQEQPADVARSGPGSRPGSAP